MVAEAEPDTTPQMSPTTSLQMELTRSAFRRRLMAALAPGTFRAAMAWKGFSSAVATAIPIISKIIPMKIMARRMRNATAVELFSMRMSDRKEIAPEIRMVTRKMVITYLICFFRSRLEASGSAFAICIITSVSNLFLVTAADRINLTA